ncbi:stage II sporulation protein D [Bacillus salitolerans]|uniref:Stage II sporulation protein D n=1 Tax=Bacillus salitolerans TaxID=1437434 RepID=A0ABW4LPM6_9BACI
MKSLKPFIVLGSLLFIVTLLIPTLLVIPFSEKTNGTLVEDIQPIVLATPEVKNESQLDVAVYRTKEQLIENIPLEQYVVGVVASEMPAEFEMEALKAQALTARTYIVQQLLLEQSLGTPKGSKVTDTVRHQVYKDLEDLKAVWGDDFEANLAKITEAVNSTSGEIITYNNEPIDAQYFSTSNGFTENSEDYWQNEFPYLRSIESPWDKESPKYLTTTTFTVAQFEQKLGVRLGESGTIGKITARTTGKRVGTIKIGDKVITGRQVREALELPSSDFDWERKGNQIVITTRGYGHGVGMSQYGANGMAREGKTYQDIVKYYYKDIAISAIDPYIPKIAAVAASK